MLLKTQLVNARDRKKKGCRAASCHGGTAYAGASPVPYGTGQAPALRRYPNTPSQEEPCLYANQPNLRTGTVTLAHHPPPLLCRGGESFSWQSPMPPAAPRNHENSCAAQRRSAGVSPAVARASRPRRTSRARYPRHGGRDARATIFKADMEGLKMNEQCGNVYENKGPLWKTGTEAGMPLKTQVLSP